MGNLTRRLFCYPQNPVFNLCWIPWCHLKFEENSVIRGWFLSGNFFSFLHWAVSVLWQMTFFWISLIQIWFNWLFYTNSKSHNDFYMSSIGKKWFDWLWSKKRPKRMSFGICTSSVQVFSRNNSSPDDCSLILCPQGNQESLKSGILGIMKLSID